MTTAHGLGKVCHLRDPARVVGHGAVRVESDDEPGHRELRHDRDPDAVEALACGVVGADDADGDDDHGERRRLHADGQARDDVRRVAGLGCARDVLHRLPARARVVLGDRDEQERHAEPDQRRAVQVPEAERTGVVRHRDRDEPDRREDRGDDHAAVQRVDDRVLTTSHAREERPDHGREDRDAAERERIQPEVCLVEADPEQHHGHRRDRVGLEEVGRHAGAVADVVADVVGDDRGIARIVLGNSGLDLPDEVGAHVGRLRVDAAAETREHGDERAAERESDEIAYRGLRAVSDPVGEHPVVAGDSEEPESYDEKARHRACAEGDLECRLQALARSLGRADVRAHRDVHPDEAGERREDRADQEAERGAPPELVVEPEQEERQDRHHGDRRVLLAEIRSGALLDRARDLLHLLVARRLLEQPPGEVQPVQNRHGRTRKREPDGVIYEEVHGPPVLPPVTK